MWQMISDFLLGLAILPIGLMLVGGGGAGFWYILTRTQSKLKYAVLLISPIQTAAGILIVYKSYDYILRMFGLHLNDWL